MRSLVVKLTLAFLLIGLTGAALVALMIHQNTRTAFVKYVDEQARQTLVNDVETYYQAAGSWNGVGDYLRTRGRDPALGHFVIINADRQIVFGRAPFLPNVPYDNPNLISQGITLTVNNAPIGWLILEGPDKRLPAGPEQDFLERVNHATIFSALVAGGLAILLGGLLALGLTRTLRELTQATDEIASGKLGMQVKIRSRDELGKLAASFNKMSRDLSRATQARRQMTADIAHDLRSPLSVISGYAEALDEGKLPGTPEVYEILHQEARHLSLLVEDLRLLSLADAGELHLTLQSMPPQVLLERAAARHAMNAQQKEIALQVEAQPDLPEIGVDVERMAQVLDNLILNAFRYTSAGGQIQLRANKLDGGVQLEVQDNGSGIGPDDLPFIFDRFYRGDKARSQNGESGLGLAIARSIVEAQNGKIKAESQLGAGTRFFIWFPAG